MRSQLISALVCLLLAVGSGAQDLSGQLNIPEGWSSEVYLSIVTDYRTLEEIRRDQVIAKTTADSLGYFTFDKAVFTDLDQIYCLHISPEAGDPEIFVSDYSEGGFGKNLVVFIASKSTPVNVERDSENLIFGKLTSSHPDVMVWKALDDAYIEHISTAYNLDEDAKAHLIPAYHNRLFELTDKRSVLARVMGCSYLIEDRMDLSTEYLNSFEQHEAFVVNVLEDLKVDYPSFANRLEKEMAIVDFQMQSRASSFFSKLELLLIGVVVFLLAVIGVLIGRLKRKNVRAVAKVELTVQEEKVKRLILDGKTNKEIAEELFISLSTVKTHINALYKKEGVGSRKELQNKRSTGV